MFKLSPSVLAADFWRLGAHLDAIKTAGATYIHLDVMDGHFVPNISIGLPVVSAIRKNTDLVLDVHLMISRPKDYIHRFAKAGADIITFHTESCWHPNEVFEVINAVKSTGKKVGISIKPDTDISSVYDFVGHVDMVLLMSVYPGFGGQDFLPQSLEKARMLRDYANKCGIALDIEMDGGIGLGNLRDVLNAGVNVVVAGSSIFGHDDVCGETKKFLQIFSEYVN